MAINVHPRDVVRLYDGGTGNMAVLADVASQARFALPVVPYVLSYVRIHFEGGTGTAVVTLVRQNPLVRPQRDFQLAVIPARGIGADLYLNVHENEMSAWYFRSGDQLVITWLNTDNGNMAWFAEVGLVEAR